MLTARAARVADMHRLAGGLASLWRAGDVIGLVGPLGAGKTTFIQGFMKALGLPKGVYVNSPTFTIVNEYPTSPPVRHFDFYRLNDADELFEVGFLDAARGNELCFVEWLDAIPDAWSAAAWRLEIVAANKARTLHLSALDADAADRMAAWVARRKSWREQA